jgi:glucose/arabinose dehydrogenase
VTERNSGRVLAVSPRGGYRVVGSVPGAFNDPGGEGGLMGVAVSPTYGRDHWVYFFLTTTSDNRIVRIRYDGRQLVGTPQDILTGIPSGYRTTAAACGSAANRACSPAPATPPTARSPRTGTAWPGRSSG